MFTGIIQAVGEVAAMQPAGGDLRLRIQTGKLDLSDVELGDSIATSGTCHFEVIVLQHDPIEEPDAVVHAAAAGESILL